ncbi:MAG: methyltetrahydrofolate cobalamin methyltransferase [Coriobacteriales bacterium]|nr:methyltetrahydrofolate cobalamin methyltransferase [Coriobacteriales bacterium]
MIIIGEKINGFIPKTLEAIKAHDEKYIKELATKQAAGRASYIDVCAGVEPAIEHETMEWLIDLVQGTVDTPLCIDSSDPQVIVDMIPRANKEGLINSISLESGKCEIVLPAIAGTNWKVVALTCDDNGIPEDPQVKFEIAKKIVALADQNGIPHDNLLIDPLVTTLATKGDSLVGFNQAVRLIKAAFPDVHITSGLSNISFGMPYRKALNTQFLALAMAAGMDSAIMDPMSADMQATMHAVDALLGNDEYCMNYLEAFREGLFGQN